MRKRHCLNLTGQFFCLLFLLVSIIAPCHGQEKLPEIIKKVQPSTVLILTYDEDGKVKAQGSGFFISKNGDIITNRHVVEDASKAEIKIGQGKVYAITGIVAEDKEYDLIRASVDIAPELVNPIKLSYSIPEVGERVIVIGSPLGLEKTVSDGIVSAVREIPRFGKIIQITAPLSPGSSGSPVVNLKGEVIGIATFQILEGQNLNFAVPSERTTKLELAKEKTLAEWKSSRRKEWLASAEGLYYTGLVHLWAEEDIEKALIYFQKAVEKDPNYADAIFQIGYCYGQLKQYREAIESLKQAIRIKPDYAEAHFFLGLAYGSLGRHREAIESYKQAIRIKPDYAEAHYFLGLAYGSLGRSSEEIESYKHAIRIKPDYAEAHCNLGAAYLGLGRYSEAIESLKQAIRIKPDYAEAHCNLGAAYGNLGRSSEEIESYKQAIRIKPDYAEAHFNLGIAYGNLGRHSEEIESYKQAIRIKPDYAEAHFNLGIAYGNLGRHSEAIESLKQAIRIKPDLAEAHCNLGVAYWSLGRYSEAIESYKQAIRIKPDYAEAHYFLGLAYIITRDKGSALDEYKILKEINKELANKLFNLIYQ